MLGKSGVDQLILTLNSLQGVFVALVNFWWIWVPLMLIVIFMETIEYYHRLIYLSGLKWVMLEIRVPQEAHKSLKAMEQIFAAFHAIALPTPPKNLKERYGKWKARVVEGKVQDWLSLEIVSFSGEIHYYIRVIEKYKTLVESQIYAHYPDSELTEVQDYMSQFPATVPTDEFDATGVELKLIKDNAFPILIYPEFEEQGAGKEDVKRIDPLAPVAQSMSSIQYGEMLAVQIVIRSTGDAWTKKAQPALDKLWERPEKVTKNGLDKTMDAIESAVGSIFGGSGEVKKEEKKEGKKFNELGPGIQDTIKAIEHSFTKLAFETGIRVMYAAPKDRYNGSDRVRMIAAAFKQFSTQALNGFKPGFSVDVDKGRNKVKKTLENKPYFWKRYRQRHFPEEVFVLNTEELTTIFHFPDIGVKTPALPRVEAKKGEAPAGLPTV